MRRVSDITKALSDRLAGGITREALLEFSPGRALTVDFYESLTEVSESFISFTAGGRLFGISGVRLELFSVGRTALRVTGEITGISATRVTGGEHEGN
ncbi:MAG: hypothetical protein LBO63_08410 [Oscillospiraceae bacterium]|nr:hypothetical protein [Oscillospiraceae bacterium]